MSKIDLLGTIKDHAATFVDDRDGARRWQDWALMVGVPVALGVVSGLFWKPHLRDVTAILTGVSVLSGLLFGLLTYVFQLRLSVAHDPRIDRNSPINRLLDALFANVGYAVFAGLTYAVVIEVANAVRPYDDVKMTALPLSVAWTCALLAFGLHWLLTVLMCLKRIRAAYNALVRAGTSTGSAREKLAESQRGRAENSEPRSSS